MVRIILPTMAAYRDDVETIFGLLEKTVPHYYQTGLEIIGKLGHFHGEQAEEHMGRMRENIRSIADGAHIVVHGFSGIDVYESGIADMRTPEGRELLKTYLRLADDIGAYYTHVHSGAGYRGKEKVRLERIRERWKIKTNMLQVKKESGTKCQLGIENLPSPSMGDVETDPDKVWRDYVDSVLACKSIVHGANLKITFDTCHYAADKGKGNIGLVTPIKDIIKEDLGLLHVSDVSGFWVPYKSTWTERVIPGDGRIGEDSFRDLFRYLRESHPDFSLGICIDVRNKDPKNPVESEEAIKRVVRWLAEV